MRWVGLPPLRGGWVEYHQCCTPLTTLPMPWSRNHSTAFSDGLRLPGALIADRERPPGQHQEHDDDQRDQLHAASTGVRYRRR